MSQKLQKKAEELPNAEASLAPQLGTDMLDLAQGIFDIRRLSNINPLEKVWMSYFLLAPMERGGRFARNFINNYLNLAVSEGGQRVRQMIQMVAGSKGTPVIGEIVKKPNWFARNITNRKWREKAEEEGKLIVE